MPPRRKKVRPEVSLGATVREDLPFPVVHYPPHYGTFIAFSESSSSKPALCLCCKPLVENYFRLRGLYKRYPNANPTVNAPLSNGTFIPSLAAESMTVDDPMSIIRFENGLCHRCNMKRPSLRYCHEMYGGEFKQHYGWYIEQTYYRLGVQPGIFVFLDDVCPVEVQGDLQRLRSMIDADLEARLEWARTTTAPFKNNRELSTLRRTVENRIESITRQEFGFRKVGERFIGETMLYQIVADIFPGEEVLKHHRPSFLNGLELDLFLPARGLAFEYQGQQHFHPIKAWGGAEALEKLRERDAQKAKMCRMLGIRLLTVDYTDPLTREFIESRLAGTE